MLQVQAQMQQHEHTLLAGNNKPPETLQCKHPTLYDILVQVCESSPEENFGPHWAQHTQLTKATGWLGAMKTTHRWIAHKLQLKLPIISPSLSTDLGSGRLVASNFNNVTEGLSIFQIWTHLSPM